MVWSDTFMVIQLVKDLDVWHFETLYRVYNLLPFNTGAILIQSA